MPARSRGPSTAYALVDAEIHIDPRTASRRAGAGIVIKNARRDVLLTKALDLPNITDREEALYEAIRTALDEGKRLGLKQLTILCPSPTIVNELIRTVEPPPHRLKKNMVVRAHMNRYRAVTIRTVRGSHNWHPARLARHETVHPEVIEKPAPRERTVSLFAGVR